MNKKIVLTGGGSAGHVVPNIALMPVLKEAGYSYEYIGSNGIEKKMIEGLCPFHTIRSGKLRRYFSWQNFKDPFNVLIAIRQSKKILKEMKPDIVFSKGGFASAPVVIAAKQLKIPTVLHESDFTPGLANKLSSRYASKILTNFPETVKFFNNNNAEHVGTPIRQDVLNGDAKTAKKLLNFDDKPVLMLMGGSLGSRALNQKLRNNLYDLLGNFNIIHITGEGGIDCGLGNIDGYAQFEFVKDELPHFFKITDLIISRAGANSLQEILALAIPNILIPLPLSASRGDQILNADSFKNRGFSVVLNQDDLTDDHFLQTINKTFAKREEYKQKMLEANTKNNVAEKIIIILDNIIKWKVKA